MKKSQIKAYADLFGKQLPLGKIQDSATRKEIILLATSLRKHGKEVEDDIESIRVKLVEGHEEDVQKWAELMRKSNNIELDAEERKKALKEAGKLTEVERINKEFTDAQAALLNEEIDIPVHKVELETLLTALADAGLFSVNASVETAAQEFAPIIKE